MELNALKKEIHASVDELEDEEILLQVAEVLETYGRLPKNEYENTLGFWQKIDKARQSIAEGKGVPDDEARIRIATIIKGV